MTTFGDQVFQYGGMPVGGQMTTGSVFFVHHTGSDGNDGKKPSTAFKTMDKATNACTANKGDIVYIMPGHNETLSAATTWVPDIAGVSYIGIGMGADAPELTFSATTSIVTVTAANVKFQNIRFVAGISAVVIGCNVTGNHVTFDHCTWDFSTTLFDFEKMIEATGADYLTVNDCKFISEVRTTGPVCALHLDDTDYLTITDNLFTGLWQTAVLRSDSTDSAGESVLVANNFMYNTDSLSTNGGIRFDSTFSGIISGNRIGWLTLSTQISWTIHGGDCLMFDNIVSHTIGLEGISTALGPVTT